MKSKPWRNENRAQWDAKWSQGDAKQPHTHAQNQKTNTNILDQKNLKKHKKKNHKTRKEEIYNYKKETTNNNKGLPNDLKELLNNKEDTKNNHKQVKKTTEKQTK